MTRPFPKTVSELLRQLDEIFPEIDVKGKTHDEIIYAGGRRSVVQFLKHWRDGALAAPAEARPRGQGRLTR